MGDWERIQKTQAGEGIGQVMAMEFDCYYQDETFRWIQNIKCTPWNASPGGKSIKAQETHAFNTYTAYELTYNIHLKTPGTVEFKYRKDSR